METEKNGGYGGYRRLGYRRLPIVEFLGKNWFVDERLKEYREVDNPHLHFRFREMEDLLGINEFLNHPISFGMLPEEEPYRIVVKKLEDIFNRAMNGDKEAFEEMAECMA